MGHQHDGTSHPPQDPPEAGPLVVGLGASAGGVKALRDLFAAVDSHSGAAYIVMPHLSPDHESHLAEVLQRTATIPVRQVTVTSAVPIEPDRVYVASPNAGLEIAGSMVKAVPYSSAEQRRAPVDLFFRTLADARGSRSVAVVLSGTGANGSAGLKRVKEYGGLVIAQEPAEAEYPDMPRNAIGTGLVDLVLPVAEIPRRIAAYFKELPREPSRGDAVREGENPRALWDVLTLVRIRTGHDFSNYKDGTLRRRVERRMHVRGRTSLAAYAQLVREEPQEAVALMKELLISVTNFFRDEYAWGTLAELVIPKLFLDKTPRDQVRVWVAGCATGEEAYSVAILLAEQAATNLDRPSVQVFATDLDEAAIATAREGLYSEAEVADLPEERLRRFFHREGEAYRVNRDLREMVLFAHHNVIKDPPFSHLDLISCRNLLIYLNRGIQERVVETFHFALRPGGYLFLGSAESPETGRDLFVRVDSAARIFESRAVTARPIPPVAESPAPLRLPNARPAEPRDSERMSSADLHQRLLEQYAPPSVVITEEHHLVHMSHGAGRFMQVPGGEPSRDLLALVRPELKADLRTALNRAAAARSPVDIRRIPVPIEGTMRRVDLSVKPVLREGDPARGYFLVSFDEAAAAEAPIEQALQLSSPAEPLTRHLEDELTRVRGQLRGTVEQYETQVEEAKASNEELQAMNEELRSAAEELETSKEELQSVNEELTTVNQELKVKIEELGLANSHLQNLINATDIGTIFLDTALRVRFSTPAARAIFNLLETDMGRPLSDFTNRLLDRDIHQDVRAVLSRLVTVEREVQAEDGRWHLIRMLPYRTSDNRIDGAVLTFVDITDRRATEARVRASEERLRMLIDSALDYAIFTTTEDGIIDSWNAGAERMFGYSAAEIIGTSAGVLFTPEDRAAGVPERELSEARQTGRAADERHHMRKDGTRVYCSGTTRPLGAPGLGFAKIARDLTAQRAAAEALRDAHGELEQRVAQRTRELQDRINEREAASEAFSGLLHRLVNAQEVERSRIARDLHDHLGQQLTALRLVLEGHAEGPEGAGGNRQTADRALELVRQIGRDLDFLAWELRPAALDEFGLSAALPRFVREWSSHVGIPAEFRVGGFEPGQLSPEAEVTFYRIAQEALNNIAKHAQASRVDVVLATSDGHVVLVVEDDGIGFEAEGDGETRRSFGLVGMRERASLIGATLQVESTHALGTSVFLRCPVYAAPDQDRADGPPRADQGEP